MTRLADVLDLDLLSAVLDDRYVAEQKHPTEPLAILNYTQRCQFDRAWNDVTRQCRGLIYDVETGEVVARPWPKFFNLGELEGEPDWEAPVEVKDKLDGSLGILYPEGDVWAIATRGSFTSEQALHASELWAERYSGVPILPRLTYLFEILYPGNRIVVDYGALDDLVLLGVLDTETGLPAEVSMSEMAPYFAAWPGPVAQTFEYRNLEEALRAEPRPNCEGLVVYFPYTNERIKLKQDDYVALHRILTGTNARNVWEAAAVAACADYIAEPKHWGSFLGIDPARAEECTALGDAWLEAVPDEFHAWVRETTDAVSELASSAYARGLALAGEAAAITDRARRYEFLRNEPLVKELMRLASTTDDFPARQLARNQIWLRCWREACPAPTAPFARSEAIA